MEAIFTFVTEQYAAVQDARHTLLEYCGNITGTDLLNENSSFGRGGSIRNLLVHMANVYEFWIAKSALGKELEFTTYHSKQNIPEIAELFKQVDIYMQEFIALFRQDVAIHIFYELNGSQNSASLLKLFTHVTTHEFHHKGQILSLSRHLGYIPVDTDIIR